MTVTKGFWVNAEEVPLYIQEIIFTKLAAAREPYTYLLRGTQGGGRNTVETARIALEKLEKWAAKVGAELKVIRDGFKEGYTKVTNVRIKIEITDPASKAIDELIVKFRGDLYYPPQDRGTWQRHRDKVNV